jgi:hypothetical protein
VTGGKQSEIIKKAQKESTVVCYLCWVRPDRSFNSCFLSLMHQNYSNAWTHIKGKHLQNEYPALCADETTVAGTVKSGGSKLKQNQITDFKSQGFQQGTSRQALTLLYRFFNDANVAIDQSNNPNLRKFVSYIVENASSFKKKTNDVFFSKYKYKKYEVEVFGEYLSLVKRLIDYTRDYYNDTFNLTTNTPCLYVSHDG